jgi:hypothetical protein
LWNSITFICFLQRQIEGLHCRIEPHNPGAASPWFDHNRCLRHPEDWAQRPARMVFVD